MEDDLRELKKELSKAKDAYSRAVKAKARLADAARSARNRVLNRDANRRRKIALAKSKIERLLLEGRNLSREEMVAICADLCD